MLFSPEILNERFLSCVQPFLHRRNISNIVPLDGSPVDDDKEEDNHQDEDDGGWW